MALTLTHFNCSMCGGRHGLKQCPAFGKTCFVCDGRNDVVKMCSQRTRKVHAVAVSVVPLDNCPQDAGNDEGVDTELFIGELEINTVDGKAWHSKMEVGGNLSNSS